MNFFEHYYFNHVRFLLTLVGQWPFDNSRVKLLKRCIICTCMSTYLAVQVSPFVKTVNFDLVMEFLSLFVGTTICVTKYMTFWINEDMMKDVFERVSSNWKELKSETERNIMKECSYESRLYGKIYLCAGMCIIFGIVVSLNLPILVDLVIPLNESRENEIPLNLEYFVDSHEYHHFILLHVQLCITCNIFCVIAVDVTFIAVTYHGTGLFNIAGYRYRHIFDHVKEIKKVDRNSVLSVRIAEAVNYHLKSIEFSNAILSCYMMSYAINFLAIVFSLTSILYNIRKNLQSNLIVAVIFAFDLFGHYGALFLNIMPAEKLIECSANIFHDTYNAYWYEAPASTQKLVSLMLQKSETSFAFTFLGIIKLSYETVIKIMHISFSYSTVLWAIQQYTSV